MDEDLPEAARRVRQALADAGIAERIRQLPQSARTAAEAAAALGCRVGQIAKSLVFRRVDTDAAVLIVASGSNRVDERLAAAHLSTGIAKADAGAQALAMPPSSAPPPATRSAASRRSGTPAPWRR